MAFPDFPFNEDLPSFVKHTDVCQYLADYTDHFHLRDHIRVGTPVYLLTALSVRETQSCHIVDDCVTVGFKYVFIFVFEERNLYLQGSNLAGARWPPHLLSGPQMFNSVGLTGPQIKFINNGLTTLYPRGQGREHFIRKWCWLLPGVGVGAGRRLLSLGRVKLIDKGFPRWTNLSTSPGKKN